MVAAAQPAVSPNPETLSGARVLVVGGSGFLGGAVIPLLVERGAQVVALARSADAADTVAALGAEVLRGDLDDEAALASVFAESAADSLVFVASLGFGHAPAVVAAAEVAGLTRAVFVSTTGIFTKLPAQSKEVRLAAEETVATSDLRWTIIRPTMIYGGPGDRNMARLLGVLRRSPVFALPGGGDRLQQPVLVDDLAEAVVASLAIDAAVGKSFNVAGPEALSFRVVVETAARALGRRVRLVSIPLAPVRRVVGLYEGRAAKPRLRVEQLDRLEEDKAFDISEAVEVLGYSPRSFSDGITLTAQRCGFIPGSEEP